ALEETVEKQRPGFHFPAQIAREPQYAIAGYAQENGVLRAIGDKHAVAHDEYVLTRALGDAAIGIQQERLVKSALNRVLHGGTCVEVLPEPLGCGGPHSRVDFSPGRDGNPHPFFQRFFAQVLAPGPGENHRLNRAISWMQAETRASPVAGGANVAIGES